MKKYFDAMMKRIFNIELKAYNLCNNIQGFERWFGSSKENRIDSSSLDPLKINKEWSKIINSEDLGKNHEYYDIRKINISGIKGPTRIQFITSESELFESLVSKDGYYIIDVEPLRKGTTLNARFIGPNGKVNLFISIIRL